MVQCSFLVLADMRIHCVHTYMCTKLNVCVYVCTQRIAEILTYVGGIELDGEVYPLSAPEARCLSVATGTKVAEDLQSRIASFAQQVSPIQTGVLPADTTYDAFKADWLYDAAVPSEENFELWKQML